MTLNFGVLATVEYSRQKDPLIQSVDKVLGTFSIV